MVLPNKYSHIYLTVRSFLAAERAYLDGSRAFDLLKKELESDRILYSDWRVHWIAATTLFRTSIDLFQVDRKMCHSDLAEGVRQEWAEISDHRDRHDIFWEFLRKERNNILHEYKWSAYERFLDRTGKEVLSPGILMIAMGDYDRELLIREGKYKGQKAIDVLERCRSWVDERLTSAIRRVGLDPDEKRNAVDFSPPLPSQPGLLDSMLTGKQALGA